jgi:hypothetical protein
MVAMLTWSFIRYSGKYRGLGGAIDQTADVILQQVNASLSSELCVWADHIWCTEFAVGL